MAYDYDAIVIGTGFGGTVAAVELGSNQRKKVLILERGVWWYSPENPLPQWIRNREQEPVQYWPRPNHTEGAQRSAGAPGASEWSAQVC